MTRIDALAEEVIRRLAMLTREKRVLIVVRKEGMTECVADYIKSSYSEDCLLTGCFEDKHVSKGFDAIDFHSVVDMPEPGEAMRELVSMHNSFLVAGLTVSQLVDLDNMDIHDEFQLLVYEALRQGKEICLFSEDLHLSAACSKFREDVIKKILRLKRWGLVFPQLDDSPYMLAGKRVISTEDIKKAGKGIVVVDKNAVVTTNAMKYMENHDISLVRNP